MIATLVISSILLWIGLIVVAAVGYAVIRQVGVLHERIAPVGALMIDKGPAVGSSAAVFELRDIGGRVVKIGGIDPAGQATLLFFVSPTCPICKKLIPILPDLVRGEGQDVRLVYASDGDAQEHRAFYDGSAMTPFPYVLSQQLGMTYQIGKLPYAILLDGDGVIRAKGLVNSREHIESLFVARERGVGSLQEYLRAQAE